MHGPFELELTGLGLCHARLRAANVVDYGDRGTLVLGLRVSLCWLAGPIRLCRTRTRRVTLHHSVTGAGFVHTGKGWIKKVRSDRYNNC